MMFDYSQYLRISKFPHIWCPGCGDGTILKALLRAVHTLQLDKNKIVLVSGIGCSSRTPGYVDFNTLHTTHGRALAFATGVKHARPDLEVIVVSGDGDGTAIGGNHFIHAARRNINITMILYNNYIYGMTGGQVSPTTPMGAYASTAQFGSIEPNFNVSELARAAGAPFVARTTAYHTAQMQSLFVKAIQKKGFSMVEVIVQCPTAFGRRNRIRTPVAMLNWMKEHSIPVKAAEKMSPEQLEGKFTTGVLWDIDRPEYTEQYQRLVEKVAGDH
ncbi:MAG TPA: 2-oxoacid:ferredoxin oxidoreductase subunit beta [bacterium]|nr:2-oxoacid:ferredoxin oxidoreductase subunit beta [bacterium]